MSSKSHEIVENEIIIELLESIVLEMAQTVKRAAHHPIFNEINDFSCALVDNKGRLIVQSIGNAPHLGTMYTSVNGALSYLEKNGIELYEGDVIIVNDPYLGGNHLPDVLVLAPIFINGKLEMFAATRGHHGDIGGARPGSFAGDSTEIYQEGLRIPPTKIYKRGELDKEILNLLLYNVRTPDYMKGDLLAQISSVRIAEKRVKSLFEKYGTSRILRARDWYFEYGKKFMIEKIRKWPKVVVEGEDYLDDDGFGNERIIIKVKVHIKDDEVFVDFTGTSKQVKGPVNATIGVTLSATYNAFISLLPPEAPINFGSLEPIKVYAPPGTIVNAQPPAAVVSGNTETSHRITDAIWKALSKIIPDEVVAADMGTTYNVSAGGIDPRTGKYYVWYLSPPGGMGARPNKDGPSAITGGKLGGTAAHISMEVFELRFPWFVEEMKLAEDSGGAGKYRGGLGIIWKIRPIGHNPIITTVIDRIKIPPYGLFGGKEGMRGLIGIEKEGKLIELNGKGTFTMTPEEVLVMRTPGGGGYGDPLERPIELVYQDFINGYISEKTAREIYGVVIENGRLDLEKSLKLREELKKRER